MSQQTARPRPRRWAAFPCRRAATTLGLVGLALLAAGAGCGDDDAPAPPGGDAAARDGSARRDGPSLETTVGHELGPRDGGPPDPDLRTQFDAGVSCATWDNWHCQGQFPDYEAVCPPGATPTRIIRCVPDWVCTCEVVGSGPETQCGYTPEPTGTDICSSLHKAFLKGCCRP